MSRDDDDPSAEEMKVFVWGGINGEEDQSGIDGLDDKSLQVLLKPAQCRPLRDFGEDEGEEQEQESLSFRDVSISAGYSHGAMTVDGRAYIAGCSANGATDPSLDKIEPSGLDYITFFKKKKAIQNGQDERTWSLLVNGGDSIFSRIPKLFLYLWGLNIRLLSIEMAMCTLAGLGRMVLLDMEMLRMSGR